MILWASPSADAATRIGVVASKRSIGNAVQRNRAKRRLRAVSRLQAAELPEGSEVVLVARPAILSVSWDDLVADFTHCTQRLDRAVFPSPSHP